MSRSRFKAAAFVVAAVASVALLAGKSLVLAATGQTSAPPTQLGALSPHQHPSPTNLKVLPRNLTGEQVHEIMETWEGELGTGCKTCHVVDKTKKTPDGHPVFNFADDSKEEKRTARMMFKMVEDINANYVSKIDSSGEPVTCGTCHRGHLGPESFVSPPPANPPAGQ